jgi:RNA polymerase sigma-70 factor (ECF subfamily)
VQPRLHLAFQRPVSAAILAPGSSSMSETADQWGQLMAAAQEGHAAAYRRLLDEIRHWLKGFYARRLPPAMVDDAVQDTLIAIHEKRHTYDPERPFKPWLMAVARYKWIDRLRSMSRSRTEELPDEIAVEDHESSVTSSVILARLMTELKPAQAEAIRLVKIEGFSVEEASERTGQSGSLIKVNIHRGLARLAAIVQKQADVE